MKPWLFVLGASVLLAACSARPLTEAQCQSISDKEIQYAVAHVPAEDAEDLREHLRKDADDDVAHCVAGKTYNQGDYKCLMHADTPESIGKCMAAVSKRLGR